jgi:hypothetical protein
MPKSAAILFPSCRKHVVWLCAGFAGLTLLPPALAAIDDPALRRSDKIDLRRLGKVSEDERSVLRIEWRVAITGVDEARSVNEMLDNLRRMEGTMAAVSILVRNMPARQPVAAPVAGVPPDSDGNFPRLMVANIAAACLVALWWFRRRKPAATARTAAAPDTGREQSGIADAPAAVALTTAPPPPKGRGDELRIEPRMASEASPPAVATATAPQAAASANPPASIPAATAAAPQPLDVDFSMEEADPETVARANARVPVPRTDNGPTRLPERRQETKVEATLQLAEIMLSMGLEQGAAQALVEYTEANPRDAVYHWLKLLGIYRKRGLHKEFAETAEKLRQNFNIQAEYVAQAGTGEVPTLEKFSRVAEHVQEIWSRPAECIDYLRRLLEDNREGARAGFPQSVAEEILFLVEILQEEGA